MPGHRHRHHHGQERSERLHEGDEAALAHGVFERYRDSNLRYSQLAPISTYEEKNTGNNLPAQIGLFATDGGEYHFLFMAERRLGKPSYLYQQSTAEPQEPACIRRKQARLLGTAACPPYHLAVVVGGTSAEYTLKIAKLASARYLDTLPTEGNRLGHAIRDPELEAQILQVAQSSGIGAQFGGKYFCHDVRAIRLPRHGASCPVGIAVSCSADRQALGKITSEGVFLEQLETDPAQYHRKPNRAT